jgi:hypothetical protein
MTQIVSPLWNSLSPMSVTMRTPYRRGGDPRVLARKLRSQGSDMDADTIARELYALRPGEFVAARNARATAAREAGERQLAAEVKGMRRPTVSAWVTNLARLEQLFSLGAALREAQAALAADKLRRLGQQRRQVIGALAAEAAALAATHGQPVGSQVVGEVEQTLQAALADAGAAEIVRAGRLTTALSYTGFGDPGDPGEPGDARAAPGAGTPGPQGAEARKGDDGAGDRRREQLRAAVAEAERVLAAATDASEDTAQRLREARAEQDEQTRTVDDLERRLTDARSALADAESTAAGVAEQHRDAEASLEEARAAVRSARDAASGS